MAKTLRSTGQRLQASALSSIVPGVAAMSQLSAHGSPTGQPNQTKIGNCSPPEEHRFKKGVSGNPKGRPRRKPAGAGGPPSGLADVIWSEANRQINVTENGHARTMTVVAGILRVMANKALSGNVHAARLFLEQARSVEQDRRRERQRCYDRQVRYKRQAAAEIQRYEAIGVQPPNPVPHPDDMQVDCVRELVTINGPANKAEKEKWDDVEAERQEMVTWIARLGDVLTGPEEGLKPYEGSRAFVLDLLNESKEELAALDATYPSEKQRRAPGYARGHSQIAKDEERAMTRPMSNAATATVDGHVSTLNKMQSCLRQVEEMLPSLEEHILNRPGHGQSVQVDAVGDDVSDAERESIVAERQELTKTISYLQSQLAGPDEALDLELQSKEDVVFLLYDTTQKLYALDERYPNAPLWQQPSTKKRRRRKQGTRGSDPPTVH